MEKLMCAWRPGERINSPLNDKKEQMSDRSKEKPTGELDVYESE